MLFKRKGAAAKGSSLNSPFSGLCMSLNSAIGSGILALPRSFNNSGIILASILIFFFALLLYTTVTMYLDLSTRWWHKKREDHLYSLPEEEVVHLSRMTRETPENKKWGLVWYIVYQVGLILMQFVTVMCYANVVAGSMAQLVHFDMQDGDACMDTANLTSGCSKAYMIWIAIYIAIQLGLAFVDLKYQAIVQNLFAVYRWLLVIVLIGLAGYSLKIDGIAETANKTGSDPAGFGSLLPTLTFSCFIHAGIAHLYAPVRGKDKNLKKMFFSLMMLVAVIYCLVACLNALAYGKALISVVTQTYLSDPKFDSAFEKGLIKFISWYPPLALTFATPNQAFPLAESFIDFFPEKLRAKLVIKIACRWFTVLVPSCIVLGVRSFTALISLSSFGGYLVCFAVPAGLVLTTKDLRSKESPFYSFWSRSWYAWTVMVWCLFSIVYTAIYFDA